MGPISKRERGKKKKEERKEIFNPECQKEKEEEKRSKMLLRRLSSTVNDDSRLPAVRLEKSGRAPVNFVRSITTLHTDTISKRKERGFHSSPNARIKSTRASREVVIRLTYLHRVYKRAKPNSVYLLWLWKHATPLSLLFLHHCCCSLRPMGRMRGKGIIATSFHLFLPPP